MKGDCLSRPPPSLACGVGTKQLGMGRVKKEPCGGWMIALFMVMSFVIGCVAPW